MKVSWGAMKKRVSLVNAILESMSFPARSSSSSRMYIPRARSRLEGRAAKSEQAHNVEGLDWPCSDSKLYKRWCAEASRLGRLDIGIIQPRIEEGLKL